MIEEIKEFISSDESRFYKILALLNKAGIEYEVKKYLFDSVKNIVIKLYKNKNSNKKVVVLGAHYDAFYRSMGINDNLCSVIVLIDFIKKIKNCKMNKPIEIVLLDKEETGMLGSDFYVRDNKDRIDYAIILDIIAYGDTIAYWANSNKIHDIFKKSDIKTLVEMLPSDNLVFDQNKIDVSLVTAVHIDDLIPGKNGYLIQPHAEFYSSFHNRKNDNNIDILNFDLPEKLLAILLKVFSKRKYKAKNNTIINKEGI